VTDQAILDFLKLAERNMSIARYKETANKLSRDRNKPYVVIDRGGGDYQVWAKDLIDKPCNVIHDTEKDGAI